MARAVKTVSKKHSLSNAFNKAKHNNSDVNSKSFSKKNLIQHLLHPDYILFDWEFFSRELEFE